MSTAQVLSMGIITSIGNNLKENLASLKHRKAGVSIPEWVATKHTFPVGEIKKSNEQLAKEAGVPADWPRTALLSMIAAKEAWQAFKQSAKGLRIAFISANTVGGMDLTETLYPKYLQDKTNTPLKPLTYHESGMVTQLVADQLVPGAWSNTISTACSSSANAIMMAAQLIEQNLFDLVIAGGADALSRFTINGFNALMILDKAPSRPFDQNRSGLNLGEGAAYLVLGNDIAKKQLGAPFLGRISGYANANDAHHQTASSPEGKGNRLAMQNALRQAGIGSEAIDYINLHGTGTENNDSSEGLAVSEVFGEHVPAASSTKTFTGHTLAAAGSVEAVYSLLAISEQQVWPHLRLATPMNTLHWLPETQGASKTIKHVLSNSFGFGGNCSSLIISAE